MREPLALSLLNDFLYCPRRAALKVVEGWRSANQHTARGDIVHEHADLRGYEVVQGVKLLRALPVFSDRLGLNGKCDIVEQRPDGSLFPVEFKVGKRRQWENDDAQLCAQALCLEEMFQTTIPRGAIFHADSKRRRDIEFTLRTADVDRKNHRRPSRLAGFNGHSAGGISGGVRGMFALRNMPAACDQPAGVIASCRRKTF